MRYLILVHASADSEDGAPWPPGQAARMAAFHEELARAGVLLDAAGLKPSRHGWRVEVVGGQPHVADGNRAIAGYTVIDVRSRDEALEWSKRLALPHEVRELAPPDGVPGPA